MQWFLRRVSFSFPKRAEVYLTILAGTLVHLSLKTLKPWIGLPALPRIWRPASKIAYSKLFLNSSDSKCNLPYYSISHDIYIYICVYMYILYIYIWIFVQIQNCWHYRMKFENIDSVYKCMITLPVNWWISYLVEATSLEKNKTNGTMLRHQAAGIARGEFGQMVDFFD